MKHYSQLTQEQRYIINLMLKIGLTQSKISEVIGIHKSTDCREIKRNRDGRGNLKNRVSIDERPAIVDTRSRVGDWEADTIIGKAHTQAIVSLTERESGLALIYKVDR